MIENYLNKMHFIIFEYRIYGYSERTLTHLRRYKMYEQTRLANVYLRPGDAFRKTQLHGNKVFAVVSTHGGTGNTSLVYELIQQFGKHPQLSKPGLVIDATFAAGGLTNAFLNVPPDRNSGLNALLRELHYTKLAGDFLHKEDVTQYIT